MHILHILRFNRSSPGIAAYFCFVILLQDIAQIAYPACLAPLKLAQNSSSALSHRRLYSSHKQTTGVQWDEIGRDIGEGVEGLAGRRKKNYAV
jgi:hypothetical protein